MHHFKTLRCGGGKRREEGPWASKGSTDNCSGKRNQRCPAFDHGVVQSRTGKRNCFDLTDLSKYSCGNSEARHDLLAAAHWFVSSSDIRLCPSPPPAFGARTPPPPPLPSSSPLSLFCLLPALPQVVITNFVPPEEVSSVERRAQWNEEASAWLIPRLELAGNSLLRMRRPVSAVGLPRPETEYARHRKGYDSNPRWVGGEGGGGGVEGVLMVMACRNL